jgi:hypothetical protein
MATDQTNELNYDAVVHHVLDRLEKLRSLSETVAMTHEQAERALSLLGDVAPPLRTLVEQAATTAGLVDEWRARSTQELRSAVAAMTAHTEESLRSANDAMRADLERVSSIVQSDLDATRTDVANTRDVCGEAARATERRSQEILNATTRTASDVGARVGELSVKLEVANQAYAQAIAKMNSDAQQSRRELTENLGALLGGVNTLAQESTILRRTVWRLTIAIGLFGIVLFASGVVILSRALRP